MRSEFYISARRIRALMTALVAAGVMAVPVTAHAWNWYSGVGCSGQPNPDTLLRPFSYSIGV